MQEADQDTERVSRAVMSGPVQCFEEEPEEAAPVKHIAKELFPIGDHPFRSGSRTWSAGFSGIFCEEQTAP